MTNNVKTPRYLEPSEIELWELARKSWPGPGGPETWREDFDRKNWQRACPASRDDALFISRCDPLTVSALLETLEKTREALALADEYVRLSKPLVWGVHYHGGDPFARSSDAQSPLNALAEYDRARSLLSGFSGDASKQEE